MKKYFLLIAALAIFLPFFCKAAQGDVVINEIAWMGSAASANNEWIELYNATDSDINLSGWKLISGDGNVQAHLKGFIIAKGFYLLERTDDNSVPQVPADLIYKGNLGNAGGDLKLYDHLGAVIDEVDFSRAWPAGNNISKQTMEKTASGWQTSTTSGGTPKTSNSQGIIQKTVLTSDSPTTAIAHPAGVFINEVLPAPAGNDTTDEFIELFNSNTTPVDISSWKLQDTKGTPTTYTFPKNSVIAANGYLVAKRPQTKITLNNDQDGINLLYPDKKVADTMAYGKAPKGQSYNKTSSGWQWSKNLTPGAANAAVVLPTGQKTDTTYLSALAAPIASQGFAPFSNPWILFLIALVITAGCAGIILLLKIKILNKKP